MCPLKSPPTKASQHAVYLSPPHPKPPKSSSYPPHTSVLAVRISLQDYSTLDGERCGICMDVVIDRGVLDCCQHW
ncbi:hypothetical protein MTR67_050748 [Solanum verrucosum]|uniref:Uncharacterized protein n=1 Tax=Solanum verrucosum TaxID=315347 RepID=A0AAF1A1I1_SOLVR|nr:hypothetical protein MTR67_050748 [Solanum verrucosum]